MGVVVGVGGVLVLIFCLSLIFVRGFFDKVGFEPQIAIYILKKWDQKSVP